MTAYIDPKPLGFRKQKVKNYEGKEF